MVIHSGYPHILDSINLLYLIFTPHAGSFEYQIHESIAGIISRFSDTGDKIGNVVPTHAVVIGIRNSEIQVVVLDIGNNFIHLFQCLCGFLFPRLCIRDDMRDVALIRSRFPRGLRPSQTPLLLLIRCVPCLGKLGGKF